MEGKCNTVQLQIYAGQEKKKCTLFYSLMYKQTNTHVFYKYISLIFKKKNSVTTGQK